MAIDPVCEQQIDEVQARLADLTVTYAKRIYYFCSPQSKHEFEGNPAEYAAQTSRGQWPCAAGMDGYVEVVRRWRGDAAAK